MLHLEQFLRLHPQMMNGVCVLPASLLDSHETGVLSSHHSFNLAPFYPSANSKRRAVLGLTIGPPRVSQLTV